LAAALNADGLMAPQQRFITSRAVMANCADGNSILDALDAAAVQNTAVRRAVKFLEQEAGLDIADPYTQRTIGELVTAGVLSAAQGEQIKALALKPVIVGRIDIETAMYNPDGSEKQ
jgi:hypothetical protein